MSEMVSQEIQTQRAVTAQRGVSPIRQWIIDHDRSWLFTIGYVGLALVLSIWISLFWLVFVVGVHCVFEWIRQCHLDPRRAGILARVLWELKLDLALVLFALALSAYMEVVLGLAGLSGAARVAHAGARAAGWTKAIRGTLLSLDDAAQLARVVFTSPKGDSKPEEPSPTFSMWAGWTEPWSWGSRLTVAFGVVCVLLLLLAPLLTSHDWPSLAALLASDLHPWPKP